MMTVRMTGVTARLGVHAARHRADRAEPVRSDARYDGGSVTV